MGLEGEAVKIIKDYWPIIVAICLAVAPALITACQSMPPGLRIGAQSTIRAAVACIDGDDAQVSKAERIKRCAGAILVEAGEAIEEIEALPPPGDAIKPSAPKVQPPSAAPPVRPPPAQPASSARRGPPCKGWPYRYKRGWG